MFVNVLLHSEVPVHTFDEIVKGERFTLKKLLMMGVTRVRQI